MSEESTAIEFRHINQEQISLVDKTDNCVKIKLLDEWQSPQLTIPRLVTLYDYFEQLPKRLKRSLKSSKTKNLHIISNLSGVQSFKLWNDIRKIEQESWKSKEQDEKSLMHLLKVAPHNTIKFVVIAFPFGYIDNARMTLIQKLHRAPNTVTFIDFAQSYGTFPIINFLFYCDHVYISFNGNKLINHGGALAVSTDSSTMPVVSNEYVVLSDKIIMAYQAQERDYLNTLNHIGKIILDSGSSVKAVLGKFIFCHRSNFHRTVLCHPDQTLFDALSKAGFGQSLLSSPQGSQLTVSSNYLEWVEKIFLLFPKRRDDHD